MMESTRVFEGRDLSTIGGSGGGASCSINANGRGGGYGDVEYGVSIPPIKDEGSYSPEQMEDDDGDEEDQGEGARRVRRAAGGETRLPGFAELNGEIKAFADRGGSVRVKIEGEEGRRGEGGVDDLHGCEQEQKHDCWV